MVTGSTTSQPSLDSITPHSRLGSPLPVIKPSWFQIPLSCFQIPLKKKMQRGEKEEGRREDERKKKEEEGG